MFAQQFRAGPDTDSSSQAVLNCDHNYPRYLLLCPWRRTTSWLYRVGVGFVPHFGLTYSDFACLPTKESCCDASSPWPVLPNSFEGSVLLSQQPTGRRTPPPDPTEQVLPVHRWISLGAGSQAPRFYAAVVAWPLSCCGILWDDLGSLCLSALRCIYSNHWCLIVSGRELCCFCNVLIVPSVQQKEKNLHQGAYLVSIVICPLSRFSDFTLLLSGTATR